jgi:hypothetical protein
MAVNMKKAVFWDITERGACTKRRISSQLASVASYC